MMACSPGFVGSIEFDCIKAVIAAIRNPTGDWKSTGKKAVWALGCALEMFDDPTPPIFGQLAEDDDLESLANEVESRLPSGNVATAAIDPALIALIIELILKWLSKRS